MPASTYGYVETAHSLIAHCVTDIAAMEKTGDLSLRFKLKQPNTTFFTASLAKINLIPKHIWEPVLKDLAGKPVFLKDIWPSQAEVSEVLARAVSASMFEQSLLAEPSTPSPTGAPAESSARTGAIPEPRRKFDEGQWATPVPGWNGRAPPVGVDGT